MRFAAALALALVAAFPARAADLSTIDCVSQKLEMAVRTQIEGDVTRNLAESGKRPSYEPSVAAGLRASAEICAKANGWSAAAAQAAARYTLARIGMPAAQRVLAKRGFDPGDLESQFQSLAEDKRNRPLSTADMQALVIASVKDEAKQTRENAELLSEYFQFLSTLQYASYDFSSA